MSDLFGNHIVGFPTRRLIYIEYSTVMRCVVIRLNYIGICDCNQKCDNLIDFKIFCHFTPNKVCDLKHFCLHLSNNVFRETIQMHLKQTAHLFFTLLVQMHLKQTAHLIFIFFKVIFYSV